MYVYINQNKLPNICKITREQLDRFSTFFFFCVIFIIRTKFVWKKMIGTSTGKFENLYITKKALFSLFFWIYLCFRLISPDDSTPLQVYFQEVMFTVLKL